MVTSYELVRNTCDKSRATNLSRHEMGVERVISNWRRGWTSISDKKLVFLSVSSLTFNKSKSRRDNMMSETYHWI